MMSDNNGKIFTVGNEKNYDKGLKQSNRFLKKGPQGDYPGGYAFSSLEHALYRRYEEGKEFEWAVYELDGDWEKDTKPSLHGWWRGITRDLEVIRRVTRALDKNVKLLDRVTKLYEADGWPDDKPNVLTIDQSLYYKGHLAKWTHYDREHPSDPAVPKWLITERPKLKGEWARAYYIVGRLAAVKKHLKGLDSEGTSSE